MGPDELDLANQALRHARRLSDAMNALTRRGIPVEPPEWASIEQIGGWTEFIMVDFHVADLEVGEGMRFQNREPQTGSQPWHAEVVRALLDATQVATTARSRAEALRLIHEAIPTPSEMPRPPTETDQTESEPE